VKLIELLFGFIVIITTFIKTSPGRNVKVHLVFAFFAPWVNISAVHCLKTTAEKNRQQAKEFAEKTKREKYF
jgi:hypothetical protein